MASSAAGCAGSLCPVGTAFALPHTGRNVNGQALRTAPSTFQAQEPRSEWSLGLPGFLGSTAAAAGAAIRSGKRRSHRVRSKTAIVPLQAAIGDAVPAIGLDKGFPPEKLMLADFCKGKKIVLVGLPVMTAWAADQGVEGSSLTFLGDPCCELTQALDLVLDHPGPMSVLGNPRCKRFSMFIDNGVIKSINVAASEEDPAGDSDPSATLVEKMLMDIEMCV